MNQLLEVVPDDPLARVNRAVLLARLRRKREAVADAEVAVQGTPLPAVVYRAACVYALLEDDQDRSLRGLAVRSLGTALHARPSLVATAVSDRDLISLREDPAFRRLVAAAHAFERIDTLDE